MAVAAGLALFCLYLATAYPTVAPQDSGELTTQAILLGIAHAPGYPLQALFGKVFDILIPWGNHAYRCNSANALVSAGAFGLLGAILCRYGRQQNPDRWSWQNQIMVLGIVILLGIHPAVWDISQRAEVFALNMAFLVILLGIALSEGSQCPPGFFLYAFVAGLGMAHQQILAALFPGTLWLFYPVVRQSSCKIRLILTAGFFFFLGLSAYVYLPIRTSQNAIFDLGNIDSPSRFLAHVFRTTYGTFRLTYANRQWDISDWLWHMKQFASMTGPGLLWGGVFGIILLWKDNKKSFVFLSLGLLLSLPLFLALARLEPSVYDIRLLMRFYHLPLIFLAAGAALGFFWLDRTFWGKWAAMAWIFWMTATSWQGAIQASKRNVFLIRDWARDILASLQTPALLLATGDTTLSATYYLVEAEKYRSDADIRVLFPGSSAWYKNVLQKRWPDLPISSGPGPLAQELLSKSDLPFSLYTTDSRILPDLILWGLVLQHTKSPPSPQEHFRRWGALKMTRWGPRVGQIPDDAFLQEVLDHYRYAVMARRH